MSTIKAIIMDRDGTLIRHVPYLADPQEVVLLDGVREALRLAISRGVLLFLHTNQSGIGRGFFDRAQADACNKRLIELLDLGPDPFVRICIAPEAPGTPSLYRKPSPAFAQEIMRDFALAPLEICYLGDRGSDLATAHAAGTCGVGLTTGLDDLRAELEALGLANHYPVFDSIAEAFASILHSY
jgi:D-glycero-D-manno-heptose 1,7-bisphosphate phosphatase